MTRLWITTLTCMLCACSNPSMLVTSQNQHGRPIEQHSLSQTNPRVLGKMLYEPFLNCTINSPLQVPVGNDFPYSRARDRLGFYKYLRFTNDTRRVNYRNGVALDEARSHLQAGNLTDAMVCLTKLKKIRLDWVQVSCGTLSWKGWSQTYQRISFLLRQILISLYRRPVKFVRCYTWRPSSTTLAATPASCPLSLNTT